MSSNIINVSIKEMINPRARRLLAMAIPTGGATSHGFTTQSRQVKGHRNNRAHYRCQGHLTAAADGVFKDAESGHEIWRSVHVCLVVYQREV